MRRPGIFLITLVLLIAAGLRLVDLTRLPPGFNSDELTDIHIAETIRSGNVASFYNVDTSHQNHVGGREALYPMFETAVHLILGDGLLCYRILSAWCGLLSVALAYALSQRLFGRFAGLITALAMALTFWPLLLSRSAMREILLLPFILCALLMLARSFHLRYKISPARPVTVSFTLLGVYMAIVVYAHWTGLMIAPIFFVFLAYLIATRQPISRRLLNTSTFTLLVALILGIPYLIFTIRNFRLSGFYVLWANRPPSIGALLDSTFRTLTGIIVRGDPSIQHNLGSEPLLGILSATLFVIGLIVAVRRWRTPSMGLMLITLVLGLAPAAWVQPAPDFTNTIIALPAIMVFIGLGGLTTAQFLLRIADPIGNFWAMTVVIILTVASAFLSIWNLFYVWPNSPDLEAAYHAQLGHIAAYVDRAQDNLSTSLCTFRLSDDPTDPTKVSDPALFKMMLHRKMVSVRFSNCLEALVLAQGGEQQRLAFAEPNTQDKISPIIDEWVKDSHPVDAASLPDGSIVEFNIAHKLADLLGKQTFQPAFWEPHKDSPPEPALLPIRMGGYLTFEGYTYIPGKNYKAGDTFTLLTYWRADGPQLPDLKIFAHILRNLNSEPARQNDLLSLDPTTLQDRDIFMQIISLPLPPDFPTGEYAISIGAYSDVSKQRVPIYDGEKPRGDRLFLDTINVSP